MPRSARASRTITVWTSLLLVSTGLAGAAEEREAKSRGELLLSFRYRFEQVADDAVAKDGRASTLRTTLAYRTPSWKGFDVFGEFEDVRDLGLGEEHANGGDGTWSNGVTGRPGIVDPEKTEVNQAFVRYRTPFGLSVDAGRLEIAFADERFVGPVGWRQNHQSFDAARATLTAIPRTTAAYAYVQGVNRINGGDLGMESHLLDVAVDAGRAGTFAPYLYALDYDDLSSAALSTTTYGVRWDGKFPLGGAWRVPLHVEGATQSDAGDNPTLVDADYLRIEAGVARDGLSFLAGWERLGGEPGKGAFQTPLATLHRFNGWADKFLTTPAAGLVDGYLGATGKTGPISWAVALHDYRADSGSASYGTEANIEASWQSSWKQTFSVKYARYSADGFSTDTSKLWIYTTWKLGAKI